MPTIVTFRCALPNVRSDPFNLAELCDQLMFNPQSQAGYLQVTFQFT
jgi:hypothetical protein